LGGKFKKFTARSDPESEAIGRVGEEVPVVFMKCAGAKIGR
jgi:hypothetical protein